LITGWKGFSQLEITHTYADPEHFSKAKLRTELFPTEQFDACLKWKISGRFEYDAAYGLSNFYPSAVRPGSAIRFFRALKLFGYFSGSFDFRLSPQHVIWGEWSGCFSPTGVGQGHARVHPACI
jgi:hypothetical protein